ncbi:hypothetical protein MAPG_04162 [Magnaporthiopsis poae ATCC 64411]|uniref:Integral membrane protein n=1 Tax=Magnaporthiopsis poae (strain ATCC 64411 / 73-15) TaxID=644358 RepID=A0A0C4DVZ4_MAGP6|nr:hypothetical protein MAPG_04162 [Magnaporthiopsis poae ATCC 64411]
MARRRRPPRAGALTELPPLKILSQMAILQAVYYAAALVLMLFTALVYGRAFSLDLLFGWQSVRGDTTQGWLTAFVWLLDGGLVVALVLVLIVVRSKLVPDFAISLHVVHLIVTWLYTGTVPRHLFWWLTMAASSACAVALGIWGCRYRELMPISFGGNGGASSSSANAGAGSSGNGQDGGDEEQGFSMGRGRGRGRDGGGEYEMMNMNGGNGAK